MFGLLMNWMKANKILPQISDTERQALEAGKGFYDYPADGKKHLWSELIQHALDDRPDPWERVDQPARAGSVELTRQFASYATALVASWPVPGPQDLPRTD